MAHAPTQAGLRLVEETGRFFQYLGRILVSGIRSREELSEIVRQMMQVGVASLPVVFFTALFTGAVIALQTYTGFIRFGATGYVGGVVALSMLREVAPVMSALMVTGRAGSAMAAEVGSMRATEQIDALIAMGADPVRYLFVPRVIAGTTMLPLLVVMADMISVVGGRLAAVTLLGANPTEYDTSTFAHTDLRDFWSGVVKSAVFGMILTLVACQKGFHATRGAAGVGRATTGAVVSASVAIVVVDLFISKLLFVL